jgi:PAT family beta-lactamase induction signal transducer AmpG
MTPTPWRWIPTLYLGQGLPYVAVMTLAVVMYKNLGVGNAEIALVTSWLYLPWVIKPLWSPLVDLLGQKRGAVKSAQSGGSDAAVPPGMCDVLCSGVCCCE